MTLLRIAVWELVVAAGVCLAAVRTRAQTTGPNASDVLTCSPTPCVIPPVQASEGGSLVNTTPIAVDPAHPKRLLLGANDTNCPDFTGWLAAFTSTSGGGFWDRAICLAYPLQYHPTIFPTVGYDRSGRMYAGGEYSDNHDGSSGFIGLQTSGDGINWSDTIVALALKNTYADTPWLVIDTNPLSPYLNRVYVSANVVGTTNQVMVSHSSDGGKNWTVAAAEPPQTGSTQDEFTTMAVERDGTLYLTWQHCPGSGAGAHCQNDRAYMLFS